ncbi:MAG: NADH-quinone oxidoreductase subunit J [Gemmataceae bacterium]
MSVFAKSPAPPADALASLLNREGLALVPLILGGLALYLLLPRPRPFPRSYGLLCALAALVTAGLYLLRPMGFSPEVGLFYAFSALALAGATLLLTQENAARAALSFVLVVLSTSGLFLLLAAPFLFAATIIVYAGAIIVTFLFVLMLAQQSGSSDADSRSREPALATLTGVLLLAVLLYVVRLAHPGNEFNDLFAEIRYAREAQTPAEMHARIQTQNPDKPAETRTLFSQAADRLSKLGLSLPSSRATDLDFEWLQLAPPEVAPEQLQRDRAEELLARLEMVLETRLRSGLTLGAGINHASNLSGVPGGTPWNEVRRDSQTRLPHLPAENTSYLGRSLYSDFLLPVEITGLLLLVATVASILIAQRRPDEELANASNTTLSQVVTHGRTS